MLGTYGFEQGGITCRYKDPVFLQYRRKDHLNLVAFYEK